MSAFLGILLQVIVNGLVIGSIYGFTSSGLGLMWGVLRIVNIAHGDLVIIGAFISYWLYWLFGVSPPLSVPLAFLSGFAMGVALYKLVLWRIVRSHELQSLLVMFSLSLLLVGSMLLAWQADVRAIPWLQFPIDLGAAYIQASRLAALIGALLMAASLFLILKTTMVGKAVRATAQNPEAAFLVGIDVEKVYMLSLGLSTAIAMVSGVLLSMINPFSPFSGGILTLYSFAVVALGGLQNPLHILLAGLVLGISESTVGTYFGQSYSPAVAFTVLLLIFIFKHSKLRLG